MGEGKSEIFLPATEENDQECTDVAFFNTNPFKFVTAHNNAIKAWTFSPTTRKLKYFDCPLGHIKRFFTCVSIDPIDEFAYCGTRSGDVLEISLSKGIYDRMGPINRKLNGAIT